MAANRLHRSLAHLWARMSAWRPAIDDQQVAAIEAEIKRSEKAHTAEIRVVIERAMSPWAVLRYGKSTRERALEVFAEVHVWDTAANNGVLVYVCLADRHVEVMPDRGALEQVPEHAWTQACSAVREAAAHDRLGQGLVDGVHALGQALTQAFPGDGRDQNELRDRPLVR